MPATDITCTEEKPAEDKDKDKDKPKPQPPAVSVVAECFLDRTVALPGVQAAGATQSMPIVGDYVLGFVIQGRPPASPGESRSTNYYAVTPDYFRAMGITLLRGRLFTERDHAEAPNVALINEAMAARYWPGVVRM